MKRLISLLVVLLAVILLVTTACGQAATESYEAERAADGAISIPPMPAEIEIAYEYEEVVSKASEGEDFSSADEERMIVRTGNMWLLVEDVPLAIEQISTMADGFTGYVVSSNMWREGERLAGRITVRVPAEHFEDAIRVLREMAVEVNSESTTSQDVTEEYVDLSAKLQNLEATEEQLLRIMEKAETVEDILNVQRELSKTRGDIEQTKGRMQYLERTSATSLIEIRLEQSKLDIEFTADKRRGVKEGQKIQFTIRQISGGFAPYSYEWDFGDGDISTDETPTHAYKTDDTYTVSLTVTDDRGNVDTETRYDYITVVPGWVVGNIISSAWNGMVIFSQVLAAIFIWLGIFSPVWIVGGIIVYWWRRRRKKAQQLGQEAENQ